MIEGMIELLVGISFLVLSFAFYHVFCRIENLEKWLAAARAELEMADHAHAELDSRIARLEEFDQAVIKFMRAQQDLNKTVDRSLVQAMMLPKDTGIAELEAAKKRLESILIAELTKDLPQ